jgi:hypothetical protein
MHAKDFIAASINRQRWVADAVLQDLTEEQLNWSPPGLANKIATILIHVTGTDDRFINMRARGQATVWESGSWSQHLGIALPPGGGGGSWEEANASNFSLEAVRGYITAVRSSVDDYITRRRTRAQGAIDRRRATDRRRPRPAHRPRRRPLRRSRRSEGCPGREGIAVLTVLQVGKFQVAGSNNVQLASL